MTHRLGAEELIELGQAGPPAARGAPRGGGRPGGGAGWVRGPPAPVFAMVDLEECVSGARDARLSSAKLALFISAGGAIAQALFGLTWLSIPTYIASLAIVPGRPLVTRGQQAPNEPFKVGCGPAVEEEEEPDGGGPGGHTDKAKGT